MKPSSLFTFELASAERKSKYREQTPSRQSLCWRVEVLDVETWEKTPPSWLGSIQIFSKWNRYHCLRSSLQVLSESWSIDNKLHLDRVYAEELKCSMLKHITTLQTSTLWLSTLRPSTNRLLDHTTSSSPPPFSFQYAVASLLNVQHLLYFEYILNPVDWRR